MSPPMVKPHEQAVVGREAELVSVREFVACCADGPASLTLRGDAGIGKTAIWRQAVVEAEVAGIAVRTCRCSQADSALSFTGIGDLFDGVDPSVLEELPEVQRRALSAALLISADGERGQPGSRVVGVAVLG